MEDPEGGGGGGGGLEPRLEPKLDHSIAYQVPIANTDIYKCSFFPQTIRDWNHFQTLSSPLLKVPRMVLLSSLLWWELGTSFPGHGPGEWLSLFWHVTSKQFWFWFWEPVFVKHYASNICLPLNMAKFA